MDDIHTQTAAAIFGVRLEDVTPEMRSRAKTINYPHFYSEGPKTMSYRDEPADTDLDFDSALDDDLDLDEDEDEDEEDDFIEADEDEDDYTDEDLYEDELDDLLGDDESDA